MLDAQGFVGILPAEEAIYVAFRGSSSYINDIEDIMAWKVDYTSFPECECKVDKGFYYAEQSVTSKVVRAVQENLARYPTYKVTVTGISFGAAVAQLISMDLQKYNIPCTLINFGQPRTGDETYSNFVKSQTGLTSWRVVHYQDPVPHLPTVTGMEYYHVCTEVYEDVDGTVRICDDTCEDPTCGAQWQWPVDCNPDDHMTYLGVYMSCASVS